MKENKMRSDESCLQWCEKDELGFNVLEVGRLIRHQEKNWLIVAVVNLNHEDEEHHNYHDDYYYNLGSVVTLQCQITGELTTRNSIELI